MRSPSPRIRHALPGRLVQALAAVSLASCVATPVLRHQLTQVETVPAGARCVTPDGEVYVTPAAIPCPRGGVLHIEVELDGHVDRRFELVTCEPGPRLSTLFFGEFLKGLADDPWERVQVAEGRAILHLEPVAVQPVNFVTAPPPDAPAPRDVPLPQ